MHSNLTYSRNFPPTTSVGQVRNVASAFKKIGATSFHYADLTNAKATLDLLGNKTLNPVSIRSLKIMFDF